MADGSIHVRNLAVCVAALLGLSACSSGGDSAAARPGETISSSGEAPSAEAETVDLSDAEMVIDVGVATVPIDDRLFGTNLAAWVGPWTLADERFRSGISDVGTTLVRMPGGSWSNSYDWLGCEQGDAERCYWTWAARPSDFVSFLQSTGLPGSWTVNVNQTAEAAAAAVAFFNGDPADQRPIGTDRNGVDWKSVGTWAQLRVDGGNIEPANVLLWEVGNELYGGKPSVGGEQCADFGWEDVWTCDGTEYVLGDGDHDGYLAIRRAMIAVDPDIEVGAVGVAPPGEWTDFGTEVIESAGDELDFYVVHRYGFDQSPTGVEALSRPAELWPKLIESVREQLPADVPIAVTEYNLVAFTSGDTEQSMTRALNALYLADTLGQFAVGGVSIANHWKYANSTAANGTNYGAINVDSLEPYPAAEGLRMWANVGGSLLPSSTDGDLHVYPTLHDDGRLTIVVVNLSESDTTVSLATAGIVGSPEAVLHSVHTDDLMSTAMTTSQPVELGAIDVPTDILFPGWSINRIEVAA